MIANELPFSAYPKGGREKLGRRPGYNTRWADAPEFMRITGVTRCAYCGLDLTKRFEDWLSIALDHVVPVSVCTDRGIETSLVWDYANTVLACAACNGFCNRYQPKANCPSTFFELRDQIFLERKAEINVRRKREERFFKAKPWECDQTLLDVAGEGGTLGIRRRWCEGRTWEYRAVRDETALLGSESELGDADMFLEESHRMTRFKDALLRLDRYPWYRLLPQVVHPEFADFVLREVRRRGGIEAANTWTEALERSLI